MQLQPEPGVALLPVAAADFEALLALRVRAMQPSLQALGRFDPERARERFAATFAPEHMQHIGVAGQRIGCVALRAKPAALRLDHLYIEPAHQNRGIGGLVMDWACAMADLRQQPLELLALQGSDANRFYQRYGLVERSRSDFDIEYQRLPAADPLQVVRALWACFQARDWAGARTLLHDDLQVQWWASGETIRGADNFIRINAEYPEGWTIYLLDTTNLLDGRVLARVRLSHPPHEFLVQSTCRVRHGRIAQASELWSTCEAPPDWRTAERFAGLTQQPGWPVIA
ncbi:MAG: GNAT family N-acetyltransferase [Rubrivivax sp.]|nr:GNAT family N-acetyltransferase [Rubrivivax sp.]